MLNMKKLSLTKTFVLSGMLVALSVMTTGCKTTNGLKSIKSCNTSTMTSGDLSNLKEDSIDYFKNVAGEKIYFEYDSHTLNSRALSTLVDQSRWLESKSKSCVVIEGHADERGTREYNLALGERRANVVKKELVKLGIESTRISTKSFGKEQPEVNGSNEESWAMNRRAVTTLTNCSR